MGLTLKSDDRGTKVIRQDKVSQNGVPYTQYSIMCSTKDGEEWINGFIDVAFPKGTNIANKTIIRINEAFPLVSKYKDRVYIKWYIKDYTELTQGEPTKAPADDQGFINVSESEADQMELPFARPNR